MQRLAAHASGLSASVRNHPRPVSNLYRQVLKAVPKVMVLYDLDLNEKQVKAAVKRLFRQNHHATDPLLIDRLLHQAENDLEETVKQWKQKTHLHRLLKTGYS